jgi:hypothetical protein
MEIDTERLAQLAALKKQLETIAGKEIDVSEEQLIQLFFRASLFSFNQGSALSQYLFVSSGESGKSCESREMLDVSSRSSTGADGKRVFLLTEFLCGAEEGYYYTFAEPVNLVVTPYAATPCYATMQYKWQQNPKDLQITVFTWNATFRYSRRASRLAHRCSRTGLESFPSPGSSVLRPLSWAPVW